MDEPDPGHVVIANGNLARMRELEQLLAGASIPARIQRPDKPGGG